MKLETLELTQFRCFEAINIEFDDRLTVLIAENGRGKTTVLDAIAIGLDEVVRYYAGGRSNSPWRAILGRKDVRLGSDFATVATAVMGESKPLLEWSESVEIQGPSEIQHLHGKRPDDLQHYLDRTWRGDTLKDTPLIVYYRAHRAFREVSNKSSFKLQEFEKKQAFESALDASAGSDAIQHWFYQVENEEAREKSARRDFDYEDQRLTAVRKAVQTMVPNATKVGFQSGATELSIQWDQSNEPGNPLAGSLSLDQLSDGYRTLLSMVMDLAVRLVIANPDRDDPLHAQCIVLIDEIDLHLHPRLQQEIIPRLQSTFTNAQFVVSTHSAEAITTVEHKNIRILTGGSIRQCPTPTFGAKASDVVRDVMGLPRLRPENCIGEAFQHLFAAIEAGDSVKARELLGVVKEWDPNRNDADITKAELLLRRIEKHRPA